MKTVKCKSGLKGWQERLQKVYSSFEEFKEYCRTYNIHRRLKYASMKSCWESNPTIQGSTNPSDIAVVYFHVIRRKDKNVVKETTERLCKNVNDSRACFLRKEDAQRYADLRN